MTTVNPADGSAWPCAVCGEPAAPDSRTDCYRCGEFFHLRLTITADGPDCGDVWIDDEVMALQFACRNCLEDRDDVVEPEAPTEAPQTERTASSRVRRAPSGTSARDLARRRR